MDILGNHSQFLGDVAPAHFYTLRNNLHAGELYNVVSKQTSLINKVATHSIFVKNTVC